MKPMLRVGFSTTTNPLSHVIRWLTRSSFSHAWLLYYDFGFLCWMVVEAQETGVRLIPFDHFKKDKTNIRIFRPRVSLDAGLFEIRDMVGERYDYVGLFGMLIVILGSWLKRKWRNPFRSSSAAFCSEAVTRVMQSAHYPLVEHLDPEGTSPEALFELLSSDGSYEIKETLK